MRDHAGVMLGRSAARCTRVRVALGLALADFLVLVAAFAGGTAMRLPTDINAHGAWINIIAGPTFPLLAALMFAGGEGRERRLASLFAAFGVLCAATFGVHVAAVWLLRAGLPGGIGVAWVSSWLWTGVPASFVLLLLWFPTGEPPGPRWRWVGRAVMVALGLIWVGTGFAGGVMPDFPGHVNPLGVDAAPTDVVTGTGMMILAASALATVASLILRYRRGNAVVRSQLRWLLATVLVIAATIALPPWAPLRGLDTVVNVAATVLLPLALAVALVRGGGRVLPRALVYGSLSTLLLLAYIAIVGGADAAFGSRVDQPAALVAAGAAVAIAAPLRARLQRAVDRLAYGDRGDPYAALSALGRRMAASPGDLLDEVVAAVAQALRAPYVGIILAGEDVAASEVGQATGGEVVVPLEVRGARIGALHVGPRTPGDGYGPRDRVLLAELARHAAVPAQAAALARDLQRSHEALVIAREEERRRIRRDLHDGLGPALAGVAFGIDAVRNTLSGRPDRADRALAALKDDVLTALADVRRLVYDLRPPALDEFGLVDALRQYGARLTEGGALAVTVKAAELPPLPAAVEVAAYRIATEALTNAARHSQACTSRVELRLTGASLHVEVRDDGVGIGPGHSRGVGLTAMRERASELGGRCTVVPEGTGGTTVTAVLPLVRTS